MPRKSAVSFEVLPGGDAIATPPQPRPDAPAAIKALFVELVASQPATHFKPGDQHLIEAFCQAILLQRWAFERLCEEGPVTADGRPSAWNSVLERAHKSSVQLSARLRMAPQSRADSRSAARQSSGARPSIYDLMAAK